MKYAIALGLLAIVLYLTWCRISSGPTDIFDDGFLDEIHEYDYGDQE